MAYKMEVMNEAGAVLGSFLLTHEDRWYHLPDRTRAPVSDIPAWCRGCAKFVAAEAVPSIETLTTQLGSAPQDAKEAVARMMKLPLVARPFNPETLERDSLLRRQTTIETLLRWRALRQSAPRCLDCGSMDIITLDDRSANATHPVTGEPIKVVARAHYSLARSWHYTVEGHLIPDRGEE